MKIIIDKIALTLGVSCVFIFSFIMFIDDKLFFSSPFSSQFYVFYILSITFSFVFISFLSFRIDKIKKLATAHFLSAIVFNLLIYTIKRVEKRCSIINEYAYVCDSLFLLLSVLTIYKLYKLPIAKEAQNRFLVFCRINLGACLGAFLLFYLKPKDMHNQHDDTQQHLLYIVLDGMPAYLLNTYYPTSPISGLDKMVSSGLAKAVPYMYTNNVYTHGYCDILFKGHNELNSVTNIFSELQKNNVYTKWIVFHQNAIPESHNINNYLGFRSSMLTETLSRFFTVLGIEHHTLLSWPGSRKFMGKRLKYIFEKLPINFDETFLWEKYIIDELKYAQSKSNKSFIYFHVPFPEFIVQSQQGAEDDMVNFHKRITQNDYTYTNSDANLVEKIRQQYVKRLVYFSKRMQDLLRALKIEGLEKTKIILTADHGTILGKNKIYYGYHSNEEVTRVPFLLFNFDDVLIKNKCYDTFDIHYSLKTLFNTFSNKEPDTQKEINDIFSPTKPSNLNKIVYINTTDSHKRKEKFFIAYQNNNKKIIYNIYDTNNITKSTCQISAFAEDCTPFLTIPSSESEFIRGKVTR